MILRASAFVIFLGVAACSDVSTEDAVLIDLPGQDQCFFRLLERPDDCAVNAPCIYADAEIDLLPTTGGSLVLTAAPIEGVWMETPPRIVEPSFHHFATTADAAANIGGVLGDLDIPTRPLSDTCLGLRPHQSVPFGDVIAFRRELLRRGVRHVELFSELADNPQRRGEIILLSSFDQLAPTLERYAHDNGLSYRDGGGGQHFSLDGDGFSVSIHPRDDVSAQALSRHFSVFMVLDVAPNGLLPTEAAMNDHADRFSRAIGTIEEARVHFIDAHLR